jgi:hypothetical protein
VNRCDSYFAMISSMFSSTSKKTGGCQNRQIKPTTRTPEPLLRRNDPNTKEKLDLVYFSNTYESIVYALTTSLSERRPAFM